jgi:tRNA(Ile2)-agmatinylcytidine synthase
MRLGIDDTDSARLGMCTTYVASMIARRLAEADIELGFSDYPNLVRLNPQVPNKTRGNGALALSVFGKPGSEDDVFEIARKTVAELSAIEDENTHPGISLVQGGGASKALRAFYQRCLHRIVSKEEATDMAASEGMRIASLKEGLGLIGAVAALGADFSTDRTFELIAYRDPRETGRARKVDESLVLKVDREVEGTFYNYDHQNHRVCITPSSPCPVHFGIRGEDPTAVLKAYRMLGGGACPTAVVFLTNQHTDAHIEIPPDLSSIAVRSSVAATGTVCTGPRSIKGGHVILRIRDESGEIDCAAYEPTKQFRGAVRKLRCGDLVTAYGSVRPAGSSYGPTINLEKVRVLSCRRRVEMNPVCPSCGSRLESMGTNAGHRCRRVGCGFKDSEMGKVKVPVTREIGEGFYEPPPVAWRHLYKPLARGVG